MPVVIFEGPAGETRIELPAGESVMHGAVDAGVDGIVAECGGALTCATCHVHVGDGWLGRLPPPELAERELLEMVEDHRPGSRLSCQLIMSDALDGMVLGIPPGNR